MVVIRDGGEKSYLSLPGARGKKVSQRNSEEHVLSAKAKLAYVLR